MKEKKHRENTTASGKYCCSVCGKEISEDEYEAYDGMCWECWDDQLTEESEDMWEEVI